MMLPRPCPPSVAVDRAKRMLGRQEPYALGAGDHHPGKLDEPFTNGGCDCYGFVTWCYELPRHRPGYNRGSWSSVEDDANCDSIIEQSEHIHEVIDRLFESVDHPAIGDLLVWPSIRDQHKRVRIGHVSIVVELAAEWDPTAPAYDHLRVIQCQAGSRPAIQLSSGALWLHRETFRGGHDKRWRTRILRAVP